MALLRAGRDCSALPWASPLRASRCGASLRPSKFVPDKFGEPERSSTPLSPPDTQNASLGGVVEWRCCVCRSGLFGPSMGLTPSRFALWGQPAAVQNCSRQFCRTGGFVHTSLSARYAKRPTRGRFAYLAEREGDRY